MVRDVAYDVCEWRDNVHHCQSLRRPITAIPIFFERRFHPTAAGAGRRRHPQPKDLEGKKSVCGLFGTTGVWTRGILVNEFGSDASKVTWVCR